MSEAAENVLDYTPPPSVEGFLTSESFLSFIVGPVGSTKTTAGIVKIAYHAKRMAPCRDGIRRSRAVWIRNTREQLRDTSIPDFLSWFPHGVAGEYLKSEYKFLLRFDDVECEVLFRGLDDADDVRRVLSMQASFAVFDEFREIHKDIFEAVQGRLGRYPDKKMVPPRPEWGVDEKGLPIGGCVMEDGQHNKRLWGMTNPPDEDTFWEEFLTEPPETAQVFFQPSGVSGEADWLQYLPSNYYEDLAEGKTEAWIDVYIHAKFGKSLSGKAVHQSFSRDLHVAKAPLKANPVSANPLIIGMDLALNPAAVIGQLDFNGRLMVLDCLHASGMGALRFAREKLKPLLVNKYPGMRALIVVDPSGVRRMDTDEKSVVDILRAEKFSVKPASTNAISMRLAAVDNYLTRMVDGKPAMLIDPDGAGMLVKAMAGKYRYKIRKNGEEEDAPEKAHPWSDVADALQYLCLHAGGGAILGSAVGARKREVKPAPHRWAA